MRWPRVLLLRLSRGPLPRLTNESSALARETWSEIGHIQILEGPETIWAFVEVVRITDYTDELFFHLMSKHPDRETVSQTVFTIDRLGNVAKTPIARNTGPGLDPDLKPIFRLSEGFYQYDAGALGRPASVYRWRGDRFSGLDERESKEVKQRLRRVEQADLLIGGRGIKPPVSNLGPKERGRVRLLRATPLASRPARLAGAEMNSFERIR